jgi:hypothetical protein
MDDVRRKSIWIAVASGLVMVLGLALVFWLSRGGESAPAADPLALRSSREAIDEAMQQFATGESAEPDAREPAAEESATPASPAWSFAVVDHADGPIADAELVHGERVVARSDARGRVALSSEAMGAEHAVPRVGWLVRHRRHRDARIDASQIGRIDRVTLDDPWPVLVHVRDANGKAIAGAKCVLSDLQARQFVLVASAMSDDAGDAAFDDVLAPGVMLSISAQGFEPYGRRLHANDDGDREVTAVLANAVDLRVRVTDAHGKRVAGARVEASYVIVSSSEIAPAIWSESTDEHGVAVLTNFPRTGRDMQFVAEADGYGSAIQVVSMNEGWAKTGVDLAFGPMAALHVHVHELDGTLRDAKPFVMYGTGGFGLPKGRVTSRPDVGEYTLEVCAGVTLNLFVDIGGATSGCVNGISVPEGETRDVDVVVPHHVALEVHVNAAEAACGTADWLTLTATDGRKGVPRAPPGMTGAGELLQYHAPLDARCRARAWVQPGRYRIAWIRDGRALLMREIDVREAQSLELALEPARTVSGVLRDTRRAPLAGWTIVAKELGGRASYSAQTSVDGRFTIEGVMPKSVELFAIVPEYEWKAPLADAVAPPATDLELALELCPVDVRTLDRDDGTAVGARVSVKSAKSVQIHAVERATDEHGALRLELPIGEWSIVAMSGDQGRSGSTVVHLGSGGAASATVYLRKRRHRTFTLSGTGDADAVHWTALEGPDVAEGSFSILALRDIKGIDTDMPNGRTAFELTKNGEPIGAPIEVAVNAGNPVVLAW